MPATTIVTYHLIVDTKARCGTFRSIDEYSTEEALVSAGANYTSGDLSGEVVGAFTLTHGPRGLTATEAIADIHHRIDAELRLRPDWRKQQSNLERYGRRADAL